MATADFTIIPLGQSTSAGEYLVEVRRRLDAQDRVRFEMHAMGTLLEGETADIFALVHEMQQVPFEAGLQRVYTILKLDERRDKEQTLEGKVRSVEERL